jgi:hypothetical protein
VSTKDGCLAHLAQRKRKQHREYGKAVHAHITQHGTPTVDAAVSSQCDELSSNDTLRQQQQQQNSGNMQCWSGQRCILLSC